MTDPKANANNKPTRAGAKALTLVRSGLNCEIVRALAREPMRQTDLLRATGSPAQTTLRAKLERLANVGLIETTRTKLFPGGVNHSLTPAGRDLTEVIAVTEAWLNRAPEKPLPLGTTAAKSTIKALTEAWTTTMLRAIAARAMTLTELSDLIVDINYPSIERRMATMRRTGLIERREASGRGNPYGATEWLRHGIGPLASAIHWERRHAAAETAPVGTIDVETGLLLAVPLLELEESTEGKCRLVVEVDRVRDLFAGVVLTAEGGRAGSCTTRIQGSVNGWVIGTPTAWLATLVEKEDGRLELGGDHSLCRNVIDSLRAAVFPDPTVLGSPTQAGIGG